MYTRENIDLIRLIHHLLKERGMTIKGAQKKIRENYEDTANNFEVVKKLQDIRRQLQDIRNEFEA